LVLAVSLAVLDRKFNIGTGIHGGHILNFKKRRDKAIELMKKAHSKKTK